MAIAVILNTYVVSATGGTTTGADTSGADLIVVALEYYKASGSNLTDSVGGGAGNTWTALTDYQNPAANSAVRIYYCSNPTVGASHTFSTTSDFSGLCVLAVSGARTATSPFDQEIGDTGGFAGATQGPGSITPSVNGCLVVTGFYQNTAGAPAPTVPAGYTAIGTPWPTATAFTGGAAYQIQTTATATNPPWTPGSVGNNYAVNAASFMPPAAAASTTGAFLLNFM